MAEMNTPEVLVNAVTRLTEAVRSLDTLLRDEYPKRSEIERTFATKLENQKIITKVIIVALISVLGCYVATIGVYSQCLVGEDSPNVCMYVPGYQERIDRRDEINTKFHKQEEQIKRLQEKAGDSR